jgi:hypothetical protein
VPVSYQRLNINPAHRYSIAVNTNITTAQSFWLGARMVTNFFSEPNADLEPEVRAIIDYLAKKDVKTPTSKDWEMGVELKCHDMNTTELVLAQALAAPARPDQTSSFEIESMGAQSRILQLKSMETRRAKAVAAAHR